MRKLSEGSLKTAFDDKIADIKLTTKHPKGRPDVYVRNGVTYGFNLLVIAELIVDNAPRPNETFSTYDYPLGVKEGHYCIAQAAPVEGLEAQEPLPPPSLADQATQPLQPGKTSGGAQPVVVHAKTFLIIRLGGDVGLKTIKSGGNFSATVAEPVVVDGVTVIPAGSSAQGIVAKEGDYGPDVTLTSLTVNGKSYKISTGYVTFNQEVVFPARSEMKFEFVLPLKLND